MALDDRNYMSERYTERQGIGKKPSPRSGKAACEIGVPAPTGRWQMPVIEGQHWHGTPVLLGPDTQFETVAKLMDFIDTRHNGIDLHRRYDGNLTTRTMLTGSEPL